SSSIGTSGSGGGSAPLNAAAIHRPLVDEPAIIGLSPSGRTGRLEQFRHVEHEEGVAHAVDGVDLVIGRIDRHAGGPDQAARRAFDDAARRHIASVVDAPDADEAGAIRIPRRGLRPRRIVVLEVVLDRRENLTALFVDDDLPDLDDAGPRARDDAAWRDITLVGAVEDEDAVIRFARGGLDAIGDDDEVVHGVDAHAIDVADARLGAANRADRGDVAVRRAREHQQAVVAGI